MKWLRYIGCLIGGCFSVSLGHQFHHTYEPDIDFDWDNALFVCNRCGKSIRGECE